MSSTTTTQIDRDASPVQEEGASTSFGIFGFDDDLNFDHEYLNEEDAEHIRNMFFHEENAPEVRPLGFNHPKAVGIWMPPEHTKDEIQEVNSLQCVSFNANCSWLNVTTVLETYRDHDIVCIQEPPWRVIKHVPSTTRADGDPYENTVGHRNFVCLGMSKDSKVCTYVNKKWSKCGPRVFPLGGKCSGVLLVVMTIGKHEHAFLNVYNHPKSFEAMDYLFDHEEDLPQLTLAVGDFNLHHPRWDYRTKMGWRKASNVGRAENLLIFMEGTLGLSLINEEGGPDTYLTNNKSVENSCVDLLWVNQTIKPDKFSINPGDRAGSDHCVLSWEVPIKHEFVHKITIKRGSKEGGRFIRGMRYTFSKLPRVYESREHVERVSAQIADDFQFFWWQLGSTPEPCKHSKSWWTQDCTVLHKKIRGIKGLMVSHKKQRGELYRIQKQHGDSPELLAAIQGHTQTIISAFDELIVTQKRFAATIKRAKRTFFDNQIQELHESRIWNVVPWTRPRREDASTMIKDADGNFVTDPTELARVLKQQFTPDNPNPVDPSVMDEIPQTAYRPLIPISEYQLYENLAKAGNFSAPGPDGISWFWLKHIIRSPEVIRKSPEGVNYTQGIDENGVEQEEVPIPNAAAGLAAFFNACLEYGVFPKEFKVSRVAAIPKPYKTDYTRVKSYRPIVLLNTLGKLFEKVLAQQLQDAAQRHSLVDDAQFGGLLMRSTTDAGMHLVHRIKQAWAKDQESAALLVDVSQFYPSINHDMMVDVLKKQGFSHMTTEFFRDYLKGRETRFVFNGVETDPTDFDTGVGQGSSLSPILSNLYIAPAVKMTNEYVQREFPGCHIQFFVDDGLIWVTTPRSELKGRVPASVNADRLSAIYKELRTNLLRFGLALEAEKTELIYFRKGFKYWFTGRKEPGINVRDPENLGPPVALHTQGHQYTMVSPSETIRYLGFYLDSQLLFKEHIRFYQTKGASTLGSLRMLGNSNRGFSPKDKRRLYISNVLPVMTYGAALWWTPTWKGHRGQLKSFQKVQSAASRWISGAFRTTPVGALDSLAGLVPVEHNINRLMRKAALRVPSLPAFHPVHKDVQDFAQDRQKRAKQSLATRHKYAQTPIAWMHMFSSLTDEIERPLHREFTPGERIEDFMSTPESQWDWSDSRCAAYFFDGPKKAATDTFRSWLIQFQHHSRDLIDHPNNYVLFTDGGVKTTKSSGGHRTMNHGAYAWSFCNGIDRNGEPKEIKQNADRCGQVTAYDAELHALSEGLHGAVQVIERRIAQDRERRPDVVASNVYGKGLVVFADNQAAARAICRGGNRKGSLFTSVASQAIRKFLELHPNNKFAVCWVPSHTDKLKFGKGNQPSQGMAEHGNKRVDAKCAELLEGVGETKDAIRDQPKWVSRSVAISKLLQNMHHKWRRMLLKQKYRGHQNLLRRSELESIKHSFKNHPLLKAGGENHKQYARLVRFITGHFPHGAFRERFNKEGPVMCPCDKDNPVLETRHHILYECPLWLRPDMPKLNHLDFTTKLNLAKRKHGPLLLLEEENYATWQDIQRFLAWNPIVATFEWGDLTEHHIKAFQQRDDGEHRWITLEAMYYDFITRVRRERFETWKRVAHQDQIKDKKGNYKPIMFNRWFRKHSQFETLFVEWVKELPETHPDVWKGFSDKLEHIMTMGNFGVSRAEERAFEKRLMRLISDGVFLTTLTGNLELRNFREAGKGGRMVDQGDILQFRKDYDPTFNTYGMRVGMLGFDLSDLKSDNEIIDVSPPSSPEPGQGSDNRRRPKDALDLGLVDTTISVPRTVFDRRHTHYGEHELDAEYQRREKRFERGAEYLLPPSPVDY